MHTLVVGKSESGKTTFVTVYLLPAFDQLKKARRVLLYDRDFHTSPRWRKSHGLPVEGFSDVDAFKEAVFSDVNCVVIVEECSDLSTAEQEELRAVAAKGRHLGHSVVLIAQRPKMIRPNLRSQTSALCCCALNPEEVKAVREVHSVAELDRVTEFPPGRALFRAGNFADATVGQVF